MKKIIAIFAYPMDNSVRTKVFDDMPSVALEMEKWKDICYLVVAFETHGEILLNPLDNDTVSKEAKPVRK